MKTFFMCRMIVLSLTAISCSEIRKENIVDSDTTIHHGDFEYYVTEVKKTEVLTCGDNTVRADGFFCIVTFHVKNHAVRTDYEWNNQEAYILDENDTVYENNVEFQKKLDLTEAFGFKEKYVTSFQSEESTQLVFELPASVKRPYLKIRGEIQLEDFLNGSSFEKTKMKLF